MPPPTIEVLGAYRVELTDELFEEAMAIKYGGIELSEGARKEAERTVRKELSAIVLLDVLVSNPDKRFDVSDFGQPGCDQAPYDEAYLSSNGTSLISRFERPADDSFRVAFFLHLFDPTKPLATSYGEVLIPALQEMPKHFQEMMPYGVVD